jgi:hypothetical protein
VLVRKGATVTLSSALVRTQMLHARADPQNPWDPENGEINFWTELLPVRSASSGCLNLIVSVS